MRRLTGRAVPGSILALSAGAAVLFVFGELAYGAALASLALPPLAYLLLDTRRRADAAVRASRKIGSRVDRMEKARRDSVATAAAAAETQSASVAALSDNVHRTEQRLLLAVSRAQEEVRRLESEVLEASRYAATSDAATRELVGTTGHLVELLERLESQNHQLNADVRAIPHDVESTLQLQRAITPTAFLPSTGGWAMDARSLLDVARLIVRRKPALVFEVGSGSSTVWLGHLIKAYGGRLVTIDHLEKYAELTRAAVVEHGLQDTVELHVRPLGDVQIQGKVWTWYMDVEEVLDSTPIDVVLVDGPPKATGALARFPALPLLLDFIADTAWIALDDAHRDDEREIVRKWRGRIPGLTREITASEDLALLRYDRPDPSHAPAPQS